MKCNLPYNSVQSPKGQLRSQTYNTATKASMVEQVESGTWAYPENDSYTERGSAGAECTDELAAHYRQSPRNRPGNFLRPLDGSETRCREAVDLDDCTQASENSDFQTEECTQAREKLSPRRTEPGQEVRTVSTAANSSTSTRHPSELYQPDVERPFMDHDGYCDEPQRNADSSWSCQSMAGDTRLLKPTTENY